MLEKQAQPRLIFNTQVFLHPFFCGVGLLLAGADFSLLRDWTPPLSVELSVRQFRPCARL